MTRKTSTFPLKSWHALFVYFPFFLSNESSLSQRLYERMEISGDESALAVSSVADEVMIFKQNSNTLLLLFSVNLEWSLKKIHYFQWPHFFPLFLKEILKFSEKFKRVLWFQFRCLCKPIETYFSKFPDNLNSGVFVKFLSQRLYKRVEPDSMFSVKPWVYNHCVFWNWNKWHHTKYSQ